MRYHNITKDDMLNGDGLRVVLWVSGCSHHCPECQNPVTWDPKEGLLFGEKEKEELFTELAKPYISGITFSGGDPLLHPAAMAAFLRRVRERTGQNVWCYTGYTLEECLADPARRECLRWIDTLVDGRYVEALRDLSLDFRGSRNQRLIDVAALHLFG